MDEVGDIGPEGFITVHEFECRPEAFALYTHPNIIDIFWSEFALNTCCVQFALKIIERDLAHYRVNHVLDLASQKDAPF